MKVLLYFEKPEKIKTSGIGRALKHQIAALTSAGVEYTLNPKDTYDLAHINTYWPDSKKLLKRLQKKHIPCIVHGHSTLEDFRNSFAGWKLMALWFNPNLLYFYKHADFIITPTAYSKRLIDSYNLGTPVIHVSNGINPSEYAYNEASVQAFKNKFHITNEKVVMGVGFPFDRKGIKDFFEVARQKPDIIFIWFGFLKNILVSRDVKKAIKRRPKNVLMPGYIDNSIIKGAYHYSQCLFFPTHEETEGIVVLEALASSCPVLVRDIGVYEDWLTDGVNCYKGKTNDEFIQKLDYIMSHDQKEITKEGLKLAEGLNLDIVGQELKHAYEEVLKNYKSK